MSGVSRGPVRALSTAGALGVLSDTGGMLVRMSFANAWDPSQGRAIPEDQVSEDGLELDEETAAELGISFDVVGGASADPSQVSPVDVRVPSTPSADD